MEHHEHDGDAIAVTVGGLAARQNEQCCVRHTLAHPTVGERSRKVNAVRNLELRGKLSKARPFGPVPHERQLRVRYGRQGAQQDVEALLGHEATHGQNAAAGVDGDGRELVRSTPQRMIGVRCSATPATRTRSGVRTEAMLTRSPLSRSPSTSPYTKVSLRFGSTAPTYKMCEWVGVEGDTVRPRARA